MLNKRSTRTLSLTSAIAVAFLSQTVAADDLQDLKAQMSAMQAKINKLESQQMKGNSKKSSTSTSGDKMKVYGQANISINNRTGSGTSATNKGTNIESNASRIGVKGHIDAVGNTKAIYQAELQYETTDDNTNSVKFREGYVGLAGKSWGKVRVGRLSTAYKSTLTKIDPWNDNAPQSRAGGIQGSSSFHSNYFNNAIDYTSPKLGSGTKIGVWYSTNPDASDQLHNAGAIKNYKGGSAAGIGIKHKMGGLKIAADIINMDADAVSGGVINDSGWQVGGQYKTGPIKVSALYEDIEDLGLGTNTYVNGIYKVGKNDLIATYGQHRDGTATASNSNKDFDTWSLGVQHKLNKKVKLFAAYVNQDNKTDNTEVKTVTTGLKVKFGY